MNNNDFRSDQFWKSFTAWQNIDEAQFNDYKWQLKNSITSIHQLKLLLENKINQSLIEDFMEGQKIAPMNIRITPYILGLINWNEAYTDPLRKQFLPAKSEMLPEHPYALSDPLSEDKFSPASILTHRYPDKVLFLPSTVCPVYCTYCTRSRLVGGSTQTKTKELYGPHPRRWEHAFNYIKQHVEIEDVVISGGDTFQIPARHIYDIGKNLLDIPNIRRIRFATKGLAVMPMKILSDNEWTLAIKALVDQGRKMGKQVYIHTHFNHPQEITKISLLAMERLFALGIIVRNQSVLLDKINSDSDTMIQLIKQLSYMNIQPYYIYLHDMVSSCEHFRTTLAEAIVIEKKIRGVTAGFNTPTMVCDLPGGGGKRSIGSYEFYDKEMGVSEWLSPCMNKDKMYYYYDPIHKLGKKAQEIWYANEKREPLSINTKDKLDRADVITENVFIA